MRIPYGSAFWTPQFAGTSVKPPQEWIRNGNERNNFIRGPRVNKIRPARNETRGNLGHARNGGGIKFFPSNLVTGQKQSYILRGRTPPPIYGGGARIQFSYLISSTFGQGWPIRRPCPRQKRPFSYRLTAIKISWHVLSPPIGNHFFFQIASFPSLTTCRVIISFDGSLDSTSRNSNIETRLRIRKTWILGSRKKIWYLVSA